MAETAPKRAKQLNVLDLFEQLKAASSASELDDTLALIASALEGEEGLKKLESNEVRFSLATKLLVTLRPGRLFSRLDPVLCMKSIDLCNKNLSFRPNLIAKPSLTRSCSLPPLQMVPYITNGLQAQVPAVRQMAMTHLQRLAANASTSPATFTFLVRPYFAP